MEWRYGNGSVKYCYDFQYENNQLTDAYYYLSSGASTNRYGMTADYDNNGNLTTLLRYGRLDNASYGLIDNLTYTYNGNQLLSVTDAVDGPNYTGAFHFIDGNTSGNDYEYDKNGNLKKDKNKNILSIQYNLLNLPTSMSLSNYNTANWTYDAKGTKLRSTFFSMSPYVYYYEDYCGSFVFRNNQLERVQFDEGYITLESSNTQKLHYYLKDHQGNVRLVVENGPDEQMNEYYPYGGLTYNSDLTNTVQPYKYNGKELDRIHGLDTYDYGARQYDPNIGRFTQVDPLAEKYYHLSPYAYCGNNPVNAVDPDGREIRIWNSTNNSYITYTIGMENYTNDKFSQRAISCLNKISSIEAGTTVLSKLISSGDNYDILNTYSDGGPKTMQFLRNEEGGGRVRAAMLLNSKYSDHDLMGALSHELYHGYEVEHKQNPATINGEVDAYLFENYVKLELGGTAGELGVSYSTAGLRYSQVMNNLIWGTSLNKQADYKQAISTFINGSIANRNGIYNNNIISANYHQYILDLLP